MASFDFDLSRLPTDVIRLIFDAIGSEARDIAALGSTCHKMRDVSKEKGAPWRKHVDAAVGRWEHERSVQRARARHRRQHEERQRRQRRIRPFKYAGYSLLLLVLVALIASPGIVGAAYFSVKTFAQQCSKATRALAAIFACCSFWIVAALVVGVLALVMTFEETEGLSECDVCLIIVWVALTFAGWLSAAVVTSLALDCSSEFASNLTSNSTANATSSDQALAFLRFGGAALGLGMFYSVVAIAVMILLFTVAIYSGS